ncbi:ArsC family reductase [Pacificimonas flava]|uniref:A glutathione-dependent thiol reductase n=1 Tax=Pacificimonas flava TaxID=1234595 RepID=M2SA45_9SPHN|nr:ArsC family reductase [Pacificimonas flava]EMD82250.1 a glutathione-dependent thiol reductase [Pacificimonas flava]MBB5280841.1 arsenate reductase [Pacificimonas flava]
MTVTLYGIANCDSVKKARKWLEEHGVAYRFHDYKKEGVRKADLESWAGEAGWETLLNRRGTTWRKLPDAEKEGVDEARAIDLMAANPSLIKRPVIAHDGPLLVGYDTARYEDAGLAA